METDGTLEVNQEYLIEIIIKGIRISQADIS